MASPLSEDLCCEVPPGHLCGICFNPMLDPVCTQFGHTYDRVCIQDWFRRGGKRDPKDGRVLKSTQLVDNIALRQAVEAHLSGLEPFSGSPQGSWSRLIKNYSWEERSDVHIRQIKASVESASGASTEKEKASSATEPDSSADPTPSEESQTPEEQFALAECYREGKGVAKDLKQAVHWYTLAAERQHGPAQNSLAWCLYLGEGVEKDLEKSAEWFGRSAEQGHAVAQANFGRCFWYGEGVPESRTEAVRWYRKSAEAGYVGAQNKLGRCLQYGRGVHVDLREAAKWYGKAMEQGRGKDEFDLGSHVTIREDQFKLAENFLRGEFVGQDLEEALRLFRWSAEQGHGGAQNSVGWCYYHGKGVGLDRGAAAEWFWLSAEQGHAVGQSNLAYCFWGAKGVARDRAKAIVWYKKSAAQGYAGARDTLGWCYQYGKSVRQDLRKAAKWYGKTKEAGNLKDDFDVSRHLAFEEAQFELANQFLRGEVVVEDFEQAMKLFRRSAGQGHARAKSKLEWCLNHREGEGAAKDGEEAPTIVSTEA